MKPTIFHAGPHAALMQDFTVAALAVLALFAALNVHGYDYTFVLQACSLFFLLSLIMLKLFGNYGLRLSLPANPAILWFTAFGGWAALSMLWSPVPGDSFLMILTLSSGLWATLLGFWANERQWGVFRLLLIPLMLLIIALTAYQAFVLKIDRPAGFLLNWNTNSAFLGAVLLPYSADYLSRVTQGQNTLLPGMLLACCAFGMSLGQGRGSLFALAIGLSLLFFVYRTQPYAYRSIALTLAWIVTGFALGDMLHGGLLAQRLVATGTDVAALNDLGTLGSGREYLWSTGWHMFLDRPGLGWGVGMFHWLYPRYRSPLHVEDGQYVHNDYLQFLIELGPIGLLLCVGWVAALFWLAWRLFRASNVAGQCFGDLALALACVAMLLHTFVDFNLYQPSMLILLGAYTGRLGLRYAQQTDSGLLNIEPSKKCTASGYFSILAAISLFLGVGLLNLAMGFQAVRDASQADQPLAALEQLEKARRFLPFIEEFQRHQGRIILDLIKNGPDRAPIAERDKLIHYALQNFDQAIEKNPLSAQNHKDKAELLLLLPGKPADIIEHLQQSLVINPYQLDTRLELFSYLEETGAGTEARRILVDGLNKSYVANPGLALEFLGKIESLMDDDSTISAPQKLTIRLQMQELARLKSASPTVQGVITFLTPWWPTPK